MPDPNFYANYDFLIKESTDQKLVPSAYKHRRNGEAFDQQNWTPFPPQAGRKPEQGAEQSTQASNTVARGLLVLLLRNLELPTSADGWKLKGPLGYSLAQNARKEAGWLATLFLIGEGFPSESCFTNTNINDREKATVALRPALRGSKIHIQFYLKTAKGTERQVSTAEYDSLADRLEGNAPAPLEITEFLAYFTPRLDQPSQPWTTAYGSIRTGHFCRFSLALNRPAYLILIWLDSEGHATPAWPALDNTWHPQLAQDIGCQLEYFFPPIPLDSRDEQLVPILGPAGLETLYAFAMESPPDLKYLTALQGIFQGKKWVSHHSLPPAATGFYQSKLPVLPVMTPLPAEPRAIGAPAASTYARPDPAVPRHQLVEAALHSLPSARYPRHALTIAHEA